MQNTEMTITIHVELTKSNFNPVHVFLHFRTFHVVVLQLILASKLGELEEFENWTANSQFASKYEFSGKWLHFPFSPFLLASW